MRKLKVNDEYLFEELEQRGRLVGCSVEGFVVDAVSSTTKGLLGPDLDGLRVDTALDILQILSM
jgi:hypothetical protein